MADYTAKPKGWKDLPPEKLAELMNRRSEGYLPALLGFTLVSVSKERVRARMEIVKHHLAPNDYLHAASVMLAGGRKPYSENSDPHFFKTAMRQRLSLSLLDSVRFL